MRDGVGRGERRLGEEGEENVFELVLACRKFCFWVDFLSEVFHGDGN